MKKIKFIFRGGVIACISISYIAILMLCSLTSFSQTTVTIGDESGWEVGEIDYPINRRYNTHSSAEIIYWQSEINTDGAITKIAFYKTSGTNTEAHPNITIYMKHTSDDTFSSGIPSLSGYTEVFEGNFTNNSTSGWMEVSLDTPFEYNNTNNLQVAIINNSGVSLEDAGPKFRRTNYGSSPRHRRYSKSESYTWTEEEHTSSNTRPNVRLVIDDTYVPECSAPTSLEVDSITYNSAKLNWTESGTANTWDIELLINDATPTGTPTISGVTSKPFLYSGLTASTEYNFYVRADCGDSNYSSWTGPYPFQTKSLEETFISLSGNEFQPGQFIGTVNEQPLIFKAFGEEGFRLTPDGTFIIGTDERKSELEIKGNILLKGEEGEGIKFLIGEAIGGIGTDLEMEIDPPIKINWNHIFQYGPNLGGVKFSTSPYPGTHIYERMRITSEGFVGIGTTNPCNLLEVAGTIRAKEVIVDETEWGDFVFSPDYYRMSFEEKALFYQINKHLPHIKPGNQIESEGLKLKSTMKGMIINIEETALDVIDLYIMIKDLEEKVNQLEKENERLRNQ